MINHSFAKEEDYSTEMERPNIIKNLKKKMSLISFYANQSVIVSRLVAKMCLISTYSKFLGLFCYFITFQGIASTPFNILTKLLNRTYFLMDHTKLYRVVIILMFLFNIFFLFSFIYIFISIRSKKNSTLTSKFICSYQIMCIINYWILCGWEIEMSILLIIKLVDQGLFYQIISSFNIIITLFISVLYCFYGNKVEFNFELCDYFSRLDTLCEFYLLVAELCTSINFVVFEKIGSNSYNPNVYLSVCLVISIINTLVITRGSFYYYNEINQLVLLLNLSTCIASITSIVSFNIESLNGSDFMILASYFIMYPVSKVILDIYWNRLLTKIPFVEIKKEQVLCKYMLMLIYLVCEEKISEEEKLKLIGIVKQHQQNCVFEGCVCKEESGTCLYIPKTESEYVIQSENFSYEHSKIYFKHLIIKEFEFLIKVTRNNNNNLIMMFSYYMLYYIGNYYSSLFALINLKKKKNLNYQQKSSLNRLCEMVQHKLESINSGTMKRINIDNSEEDYKVDFGNLIMFYEKVTKLKMSINLALDLSTQFWTCIQNRADIHMIKKHGLEFYKYHNIIEETYKEIIEIYDNLAEVNLYYIRYKAAVFNEQPELFYPEEGSLNINMQNGNFNTKAYIQNYANLNQNGNSSKVNEDKIQENEKYFHPKCVVVIANLTDKNKAIIERISENIKKLLNYSPTECLGQDVKLLMPNIYKGTHNNFIQIHFETGKNNIINHERPTFALHANYYSIPVMLSVKMLPSYTEGVYYIGVLREIPIDYDFIITTQNGKLEMISKGIFNKIFNSSTIALYNSIDYYINFICKEYFNEISKIFDSSYKLTDFTLENPEKKEYKYALLHFRSDSIIDNILRDFKKNETNSLNSFNNSQYTSLESPIIKILQMKDKILQNYKKDSIKKYAQIEKFNVFLDEYLVKFKLFSTINSDGNVNLDEVKVIDKYINKKEDDIEDKYHSMRLLYGTPAPNEGKGKKNGNEYYTAKVLQKPKEIKKQNKKKEFMFLNGSVNKKNIDKEQFKVYLTMKNRYSQKKEYAEVKFIMLYNIFFLLGMLVIVIVNYIFHEEKILKIFKSIEKEYFSIVPLFVDIAMVHKNLIYFIHKDYFFITEDQNEYLHYLYNISEIAVSNLTANIKLLTDNSYEFSKTFLDNFNTELTFKRVNYDNVNMTLNNYFLTIIVLINSLPNNDNLGEINVNIQNILLNLNWEFYQLLGNVFIVSLNSTMRDVENLKQLKEIYSLVLIGINVLFGSYVYARILCFYCVQNNMIGMLLSINIDECDSILRLIRELKAMSQKKQSENSEEVESKREVNESQKDNDNDNQINDNNENDNTDNDKDKENNTSRTPKEHEKEESDNLIDRTGYDSLEENKGISYLSKKIRKVVDEHVNKKKKGKTNEFGHLQKTNNIPIKVYLLFLARILIIMILNLSPFIVSLSYKFYENKCNKIIHLIQNLNQNNYMFIVSFLLFQNITLSQNIEQNNILFLKEALDAMKLDQFKTSMLLFTTIIGIPNQNSFETFFTKNFCGEVNVPERYCNDTSPYYEQSFVFIMNINIELIEDALLNTNITKKNIQTIEEINFSLQYSTFLFADENFNLLGIYGFPALNIFMTKLIETFRNSFHRFQVILFVFNLLWMVLNQIVSIWLMKHIIEAVDVELKHIFSLMPFPLAIEDKNIKMLYMK